MDRDRQKDQGPEKVGHPRLGRTWTERLTGPIRYRRYTDKDAGGRPCIFIKIEEPTGESDLATAVYSAIKQLKFVETADGRRQPTGLTFNRDRIHGRVYKLPENPLGTLAADRIDAKLSQLAHSFAEEQETADRIQAGLKAAARKLSQEPDKGR